MSEESLYVMEVLVNCSSKPTKTATGSIPNPCPPGEKGEMQVRYSAPFPINLAILLYNISLYSLRTFRTLDFDN